MSTWLQGRGASPGVAVAPAFVVAPRERPDELPDAHDGDARRERRRLDEALEQAERDLRDIAEAMTTAADEGQGAIFEAHAEFVADPELASLAREAIDKGTSAEKAVRDAFDEFSGLLAASADEYLAARAADLDDARDRVVDILTGAGPAPVPTRRCVVVATDLTPSDTARLPTELIAGIACEQGSSVSHAAIIARSIGIPAVVGTSGLLETVAADTLVGVDGSTGEVVADPDEEARRDLDERAADERERRRRLASLKGEEGRTSDGRRVEVAANLNGPDAVDPAVEEGAEGSGLVRTEFLFQDRSEAPDVDLQVEQYQTILRAFPNHRVVVRTMDIGADKPLPFVDRDPEQNPALGVRGLRLGLVMPDLLRDQLRALLRARAGLRDAARLAIMFPMVSVPGELTDARRMLEEVAGEEDADLDGVEVGAMIEVPAAALAARRLAREADFLSVGTNDLLQYLFAADRLLADVAGLPDPLVPEVLGLLDRVVADAHAEGAWIGVCGEAAADPVHAAAFVGLGVDELSMSAASILEIKDLLRRVDAGRLRKAVEAAIAAPDAGRARTCVEEAIPAP
ncbi:MAG: phosphoenolpyruvate--protein phosphotransferase [Actinobacteria bacterium]|nr:phosphoenolpyruvate--protein phosphotransferase [Actinomycetota bacterium]